ncbi:cilia- and flagella-associated protein 70-like isoform X4 [Ptychodera flava]|uniref:cilia- and flagella-associated protein 70-like isoform X4 n=1 Tax=Ptychodera flava TaxID=63121 RepID=UPI00396A9516
MASEDEGPKVRPPENVNITVLRARNLRGSKGDNLNSLVRVEYNNQSLGESPKVESTAEYAAEYNYNARFECTFDDPLTLDEIAYKPVMVTVIEVLPKEKKQKEEKTLLLGQSTVDLLPLLRGENRYKSTLVVHPLPGSPLETAPPDQAKVELDVVVFVNEPLLSEEQLKEVNLLTVSVETLYSPPEAWNPTGAPFIYNVTLPVPITADRETTVVATNGIIKAGTDKDLPSRQKKWCVPGNAQGGAIYIPDSFVPTTNFDEEDGDFTSKEDREFRNEAEMEKTRVTWNIERRCFMDPAAVQSFQNKIAQTRVWPVEIMRTPVPTATKGKGKSGSASAREDETPIFYHGVAYVNLAPLLYPGVKKIRGAYKVMAFSDHEVFEKIPWAERWEHWQEYATKRKGGLAEEAIRVATAMNRNASPFAKGGKAPKEEKGGKEKEKDAAKKVQPSSMLKPTSDAGSETDVTPPQNLEGMQYVEAKSYLMLEITLQRPLVPKRPPEVLAKRVAELIPPRPLFARRTNGAERAVEDFHSQVASVGNLVLEEFRSLFADQLIQGDLPSGSEPSDERRRKLLYELNTSGKYFAFKEQLKHSVVKIVREKYLKTTTFTDKEELHTFLSELNVFLIDQMHVGLGKVLSLEDETPVPPPLTDSAQLKHFAREAEVNENFEVASKYYQERIARNRNDGDHWFDYGTFCMLINDISKAEECFKETVSINQSHVNGLLLYGIVCAMEERNSVAETFFEMATNVEPNCTLAWTLLGLFYDGIENDIQAEFAFLEANKRNVANAAAKVKSAMPEETEKENVVEGGDAEPEREKVVKTPATPSESGKSHRSGKDKPGSVASAHKKKLSVSSKSDSLHSLLQMDKAPDGGTRKQSAQSNRPTSQPAEGSQQGTPFEEEIPPREPTPVPETSIFMIAVDFLLEVKAMNFCERALAHELLSPTGGPSAAYYVALARLKLQKKELEEANDNLQEALVLNHQDPDAWAITGHLRYLEGDIGEAKSCYERTLSFVADAREMHSIYLRLASIYLQENKFEDAKNTFLLACKKSPSCVSWLGVGIACYRLGELGEAEDALSEANILNNTDSEVWGYLSLVCLKTNRQLEAEQAYKYALKVGLQDEGLLGEIHEIQEAVGFGNPQF